MYQHLTYVLGYNFNSQLQYCNLKQNSYRSGKWNPKTQCFSIPAQLFLSVLTSNANCPFDLLNDQDDVTTEIKGN